jgi:phosphate transport system substrate-binding protein
MLRYNVTKEALKLISIDSGSGCIAPSTATIAENQYQPLTRRQDQKRARPVAARPHFPEHQHLAYLGRRVSVM